MTDRRAGIHPGQILQCFDHFVVDLRGEGRQAAYFTVYAVEYSPELGTGHVAFLRVRSADPEADVDLTLTDAPETARRMQARLRRMIATVDISRGVGTELEQEPLPARFTRLPWTEEGVGWRVEPTSDAGPPEGGFPAAIEASWRGGARPIWTAAMAGTFTGERDILGMLAEFDEASLRIGDHEVAGRPYQDPWWDSRLGRPFSSCHVALAEASLTPAGSGWWRSLG